MFINYFSNQKIMKPLSGGRKRTSTITMCSFTVTHSNP